MIFRVSDDCYAAAVGSYHVPFRHRVFGVVSAFGVYVRFECQQQFFDSWLVKNCDVTHTFQRSNNLSALTGGKNGATRTSEPFHLRIRIDADNQNVSQFACAREITNVSYVQHVETTVCENNA